MGFQSTMIVILVKGEIWTQTCVHAGKTLCAHESRSLANVATSQGTWQAKNCHQKPEERPRIAPLTTLKRNQFY